MKRKDLGIVKPKIFRHEADLALESGKSLNAFELIYETYGELNENRSNAIPVSYTHLRAHET